MSILSDWVQPEINYDLTDRPLIDEMDEITVTEKPDEEALWLFADGGLFAISKPGRQYELHVALKPTVDADLTDGPRLRSFVRTKHEYDHNLDGINFVPPTNTRPGCKSDVEASMFRTRYGAVRGLYRTVDFYADFPRYEQVKSYDDQAIMDRAEYDQASNPLIVDTLVGHQPGRGIALTRDDRTYLFRPDKLTALALAKKPRGATDREVIKQ